MMYMYRIKVIYEGVLLGYFCGWDMFYIDVDFDRYLEFVTKRFVAKVLKNICSNPRYKTGWDFVIQKQSFTFSNLAIWKDILKGCE